MASKSKKASEFPQRKGFGTPSLTKKAPLGQLRRANTLVENHKLAEAKTVLTMLNQTYPQDSEVLVMLVNVCLDMGDMVDYGKACAQLVRVDSKNGDVAYALAGAYMANGHPILALQALRQAVEKFPNHEKARATQTTIADLQLEVDELLAEMALAGEAGVEIALLHEQGQVYLAQGDLSLAQQAEETVLKLRPDFVSARNNLSLISWQQGNFDKAIVTAQQVLAQASDNIHALSNLIHFYTLKGEFEAAIALSDRLKASSGQAWDSWAKKAEGLSYLRDDAGVLDLWEQAQAAGEAETASTRPLFLHLVAVALARLGQTKAAKQQWQKLLKQFPNDELALANLADLNQPIGQRQGAWPFPLSSWLDPNIGPELRKILQSVAKSKDEAQLARATARYLAEHPYMVKLLPILLERGDPTGRALAMHLATLVKTPELLEALKEFAFGQWGTDEMRHQAAVKLVEAKFLPDRQVRLWLKGEWQELLLIAYEFHDEPSVLHTRPVTALHDQARALLRKNSIPAAQQAEDLLQQALQMAPDAPDLQQNLAVAYLIQAREAEAKALIYQLAAQYPDYLFAQVSVARFHILADELVEAEAILKPMLSRQRFSFNEFGEFSDVYIHLLTAQKNYEAAKGWLKMWEGVDPEHPSLKRWQALLRIGNLGKTLENLFTRGKKRQ